jgi:hypothetical protein
MKELQNTKKLSFETGIKAKRNNNKRETFDDQVMFHHIKNWRKLPKEDDFEA